MTPTQQPEGPRERAYLGDIANRGAGPRATPEEWSRLRDHSKQAGLIGHRLAILGDALAALGHEILRTLRLR